MWLFALAGPVTVDRGYKKPPITYSRQNLGTTAKYKNTYPR
jgi:hypothetical protein